MESVSLNHRTNVDWIVERAEKIWAFLSQLCLYLFFFFFIPVKYAGKVQHTRLLMALSLWLSLWWSWWIINVFSTQLHLSAQIVRAGQSGLVVITSFGCLEVFIPTNPTLYSNLVFTPVYQQGCMDSDPWRWPPLSGVNDVTLTADWSWRLSVTLLHECNIIEIERAGVSVECRVQWDDGVLEKKVFSSVNLNIVGNIHGNLSTKLNKPIHKKC